MKKTKKGQPLTINKRMTRRKVRRLEARRAKRRDSKRRAR